MLICGIYAIAFALAALEPLPVTAQVPTEKVWAAFAFTLHGDSTPAVLPQSKVLTRYGARQLYAAGSAFRERYIEPYPSEGTNIQNISPFVLNSEEVDVLAITKQPIVASAQAFMQGLYPPLEQSYNAANHDPSVLRNGSSTYPFGGYQYPQFVTFRTTDFGYERMAGHTECPVYEASKQAYRTSADFKRINQESAEFYARIYDQALYHAFGRSEANYNNAGYISEYLDYITAQNSTAINDLGQEDLLRARWLADRYVQATNNASFSRGTLVYGIRPIAGRTLASLILEVFRQNIESRGHTKKLVLAFGGDEPPVALASLLQMKEANFYSRPVRGASITFELYSYGNHSSTSYPEVSDLYVRFFLHNETDSPTTGFAPYPLLGRSPDDGSLRFTEFNDYMQNVSVNSTEWCIGCGSSAVFCSGVLDDELVDWLNVPLNPVVAGVIGAVITLIIVFVIIVIWFLIYGMRFQRTSDSGTTFENDNESAAPSMLQPTKVRENV